MPVRKEKRLARTEFHPGDQVYARWFGDEILTVVKKAKVDSCFPHYVCKIDGDEYLIAQVYLSSERIIGKVTDGNRRQLSLAIA
jgi:hypothetical protein